jgi:hypothetical protein
MATVLSGHAFPNMPTQGRGHGTRQLAIDGPVGQACMPMGQFRSAERRRTCIVPVPNGAQRRPKAREAQAVVTRGCPQAKASAGQIHRKQHRGRAPPLLRRSADTTEGSSLRRTPSRVSSRLYLARSVTDLMDPDPRRLFALCFCWLHKDAPSRKVFAIHEPKVQPGRKSSQSI